MAYELNRGKYVLPYVLYLTAVQNLIEDNASHAKMLLGNTTFLRVLIIFANHYTFLVYCSTCVYVYVCVYSMCM